MRLKLFIEKNIQRYLIDKKLKWFQLNCEAFLDNMIKHRADSKGEGGCGYAPFVLRSI